MKRAFAVLLCAVVCAGCSETFCQRAERTNTDIAMKASRGGCNLPSVPFHTQNCENEQQGCTEQDLATMNQVMDCLEPVQCEHFKEADFDAAYSECVKPLSGIPLDCLVAHGP